MEVDFSSVLEGISALGLAVAGVVKWVTARLSRLERENRQAQERLTSEHERSQSACRADNAALVARLEKIEDRAHQENRDERAVMLKTLQLNAQAFSKLADRLPDNPTPPTGGRI